MDEDKEKIQTLKNPSIREKVKKIIEDPSIELAMRICHLESYIKELGNELEYTKKQWHKYYSHMCLFFLMVGCIIGFIVGAILL